MPTAPKTASYGVASEPIAAYEAAISRGSPTNTLEGLRSTAMNTISTLSSSKAVRAWDRMDELDAMWGRKTAGLVQVVKGKTASAKTALHVDLLPLARGIKAKAVVVARVLLAKDLRVAAFMQMHAARSSDPAAKVLASILAEEMPAGRKASAARLAGGLYGFPTRTARLGLAACAELTARAGELTFRAHATHQAFHRPMTATLARSQDPTARLLLASYPQDKKAGEAPEHLKEHQFTEDDNPNPKGNDADGDGKSFEKKPDFLKKKDKKAGFDAEEIGEESGGPVQADKGESFMKGHFTQENFSGMESEFGKSASVPRTVKGWLEWELD